MRGGLAAALLILLSGCGDGGPEPAIEPEPSPLERTVKQVDQANIAAIGALQRAKALEQSQLQQAERRRREMAAQGI